MKRYALTVIAAAALLAGAACNKKAPVAKATAPDPTPVQNAPASNPPQQRAANNTTPPATRNDTSAPARGNTMPPEVRKNLNERLARLSDALFDYDKASIRDDARGALREDVNVIRGILADWPSQKLLIEGHADERGSEEYNMALGDKRARAAQEFLASMGIPNAQLTIVSYGKDRPVCTDKTEDCWQKNRRAHVTAAP